MTRQLRLHGCTFSKRMKVAMVVGLCGTVNEAAWAEQPRSSASPQPAVPGVAMPRDVSAAEGRAPGDAKALFSGSDLDAWEPPRAEDDPRWKVESGVLVVTPGAGNLVSREAFGDVQLHLEYRTPLPVTGTGAARGNSGVLFMGRYEVQLLDSFGNPTDGTLASAAVFRQQAPLVNTSRAPGEWQTLDVLFWAPRPRDDSVVPARVTVFHNGVLVQNDATLRGETLEDEAPAYQRHPAKLPLVLQDGGSAVAFRNVWVRDLSGVESR